MSKYVYSFGPGARDGSAAMRDLLGGNGANLAEMASIGLPVSSNYTATTEICTAFYDNERNYPTWLAEQVDEALAKVEDEVGRKFGEKHNPLLVSVRSGARVSMPGMMDTVLNLGLNDETVEGLARLTGDPSRPGPFTARVKFPPGFALPPHRHSTDEHVTVLIGTVMAGRGERLDRATARAPGTRTPPGRRSLVTYCREHGDR